MRAEFLLAIGFVLLGGELSAAQSCNPIQTFADGKIPSREIFVSPSGSNSSGNGSRENPFQTVNRALQGVNAGDAIRLLPGNYPGGAYIANLAGTAEAPIWIGGEPGQARPIINGGANGFHFSASRYVIVENLEIDGATGNGINCDDGGDYTNPPTAHHLIFRNLAFRNVGTGGNNDGLKVSGIYDFFVLDCTFNRISAGGSGIDHVGCHRGLIARCSFTETGNAIQCKGGSADIEIRWNRFLNAGGRAINIGGSTGFSFFRPPLSATEPNAESREIRVLANLFQGSDAPVAFVGTVNSLVANNTFIDPTRWVFRILQETTSTAEYQFLPCGNNRFVNNLVYFNRGQLSTFVNVGANTDAASFDFGHNLWYAHDQPNQSRPNLPAAEADGIYGTDPLLHDPEAGDFSLPRGSPATGRGLALETARADLLERCYANPPSIGAFEANPPPAPGADLDADGMPDDWEDKHAFNKEDPSDAGLDEDGDRLSNYGEFLAGTHPRDPGSVFVLTSPAVEEQLFAFRFSGISGRSYFVESSDFVLPLEWSVLSPALGADQEMHIERPLTVSGRFYRVRIAASP